MLPENLLVLTILACRTAALPSLAGGTGGGAYESSEADGEVRQSSSAFGTAGLLAFTSGHAFESTVGDSPVNKEGAQSTTSETSARSSTPSPDNSTGLYSIGNVTIQQYPPSTNGLNSSSQTTILENVNLWVFSIDSGRPNPATAAQCNLTWTASTASPSSPPATGQMRCRSQNTDVVSQGLPNYSPRYNVTFQQQTESPLTGFDIFVTSGYEIRFTG